MPRTILVSAALASLSVAQAFAGDGPPGALISLGSLAASGGGFKILNRDTLDEAGIAITGVGDVNRDGRADLLIGVKYDGSAGHEAGAAYVVLGKTDGATADLAEVGAGRGGFKITGEAAGDHTGYAVAGPGDVDRDGVADLLVGGRYNDAAGKDAGAAYLVRGKADGGEIKLRDVASGLGGFKILGQIANDYAGFSVAPAGDMNGDGARDLLIGAHYNDAGGATAGAVYVVFGKTGGGVVDLDNVARGVGGFRIVGQAAGDQAGWSVAALGDMNGDGRGELLIGAPTNAGGGTKSGAAFVVFGKATGTEVRLASLGTAGFRIVGERGTDNAGWSVASAGDMNGDGRGDLVIGARANDANGTDSGAAYVVWGKAATTAVNLDNVATGKGGFKILGQAAGDYAGWSVAGIGDVNGNGVPDLLVGAVRHDTPAANAGAAYVVYGKKSGTAIRLADVAAGTGGFRIVGEAAGDWAGTSVAAGGDINGDGRPDLLVGCRFNDEGAFDAGAGYVVFGADSWLGDS